MLALALTHDCKNRNRGMKLVQLCKENIKFSARMMTYRIFPYLEERVVSMHKR